MNFGRILDHPVVWEISRRGLDLVFGLYSKRIRKLREWDLLRDDPDVLDVGCGIGFYASITHGRYLGVDMQPGYIEHARARNRGTNHEFRCGDVTEILDERSTFDLVLMVDFLHHLPDRTCRDLLGACASLARKFVVSFEPVTFQPHWLGRWIVNHDRGDHVRSLDDLHSLFESSGLEIVESSELRLGPINTRAILSRPRRADHL